MRFSGKEARCRCGAMFTLGSRGVYARLVHCSPSLSYVTGFEIAAVGAPAKGAAKVGKTLQREDMEGSALVEGARARQTSVLQREPEPAEWR